MTEPVVPGEERPTVQQVRAHILAFVDECVEKPLGEVRPEFRRSFLGELLDELLLAVARPALPAPEPPNPADTEIAATLEAALRALSWSDSLARVHYALEIVRGAVLPAAPAPPDPQFQEPK